MYKPIPEEVTLLVKAILINIPSILVIKPPIIKIIVDLIKLFFIFKYMYCCFGLEMS